MHAKALLFFVLYGMLRLHSIVCTKMRLPRRPRRVWKLALIAWAVVLAVQVLTGTATPQTAPEPTLAPILDEGAPNTIPGEYIVVFKPGTSREAVQAAQRTVKNLGGTVGHTYMWALTGFSAKLPMSALEALRAAPGVAYIATAKMGSVGTIELNPPAGLDRTSERLLPLDARYTYSETGAGVNVYVIDTGIRTTHTQFGGRAFGAFTAIMDGLGTDDCNGHGTHVAGTIGGTTFGIAKQVTLHAVRVGNCFNAISTPNAIAGVDWITNPANRSLPAVANMSIQVIPADATLDNAVRASIDSGVTYVVAAGDFNVGACSISPARASQPDPNFPATAIAITVGSIDPNNDTRDPNTAYGPCVNLFAPGVNIKSAWNTSDTADNTISGTSMATPHVSGVAARYLQNHPLASPAAVWNAIHYANNISTTLNWPGVMNAGLGSPNELLHWGSLNDGYNDGDPHLTTVDGIHYDLQSAGEFVSLRDGNGLEIQTRQTAIATTFNPGPNPYTGLATCVSLNTAVAARVGAYRVTYQPNISGLPYSSGLQLRVDGVLTTLGPNGLDLGDGGRVVKSPVGDGIEIDFPDETVVFVTPSWWASQSKWYLNVDVYHTGATEGIMGTIAPDGWLPALPDGTSLGPRPAALHQRYVDLYQKFANAWRVTDKTSLFDYAPATSTATFTLSSWPPENPPCVLAETRPVTPASLLTAQTACRPITDKNMNRNCVFDVRVTGEPGFAKTYLLSQRIRFGSTTTTLHGEHATQVGEWVTFTAIVARNASNGKGAPTGSVRFILDGSKVGEPVKLDSKGRATWKTSRLKVGNHLVAAVYIPSRSSVFLASRSLDKFHTVKRCTCIPIAGNK